MKKFIPGILCGLLIFFTGDAIAQNVWTQHNDQARTGWYPYETTLNINNVNKNTFGLNFSQTTDDKVVAQPLVVMHVNVSGVGFKNIVIVATLNNTVYAFDADLGTPYWQKNFTNKIAPTGSPCSNCRPAASTDIHPSLCYSLYPDFTGNMGIVGTPVVDTLRGVMYFVTKIAQGNVDNHKFKPGVYDEYNYTTTGFHQYLHAVDIKTGLDLVNSPVEIAAVANGTGDGQVPANSHNIPFEPRRQFNRAGLVLNNGILYIAFAAHCDFNPSHGWVMSFDTATLAVKKTFITTPNDGRGGIWMSGTAPAVDAAGNIYFTTGNSLNESSSTFSGEVHSFTTLPSDPLNRGESVVKLAPDLTLSDYFTPFDYIALNDADKDFPIQVMLLPNTGTPGLALTGNKDDSLFVLNQGNLGGFNTVKNNVKQSVFVNGFCEMHSTFAYFGGGTTPYAYQYSENSPLRAYPVSAAGLGTAITNNMILGPTGGTGGFLSVSSNGGDPNTGILWAYQAINGCDANSTTCQGILHAVKASDITKELWNSDQSGVPDHIDIFNKMSCPTIALGKVYLASNFNQLRVYGLKTNSTCLNNVSLGKPATAPFTAGGSSTAFVDDNSLSTEWIDGMNRDADSIYIDLGSNFNICRVALVWDITGYASDFDIKVSNDLVNWTVIKSFRGNTVNTTEFDGVASGRYVSVVGITRGTANPYSIFDFQVFGTPGSTCSAPTNLTAAPGSYTTIFTTQTPTGTPAQDNHGGGVELGVKFRSSTAGYITGIRFYKTIGYSGTHIGELYTSTGTRLALATFGAETTSGWQTVTFSAPVAILANTTYIAAYYNATAYYVADNNGLNTAVTNGNLTALANGTDGGNGVYAYSPTTPAFPNNTFGSSNYWVDPIFSPTSTLDLSSAHLSWDPVPSATLYTINYRPNLSTSWITRTSTVNAINISALSCGTVYNYTVQTTCGAGQSTISSGSFTTPGCPTNSCDLFPVRYFSLDVGDIGVAGSTCKNGNVYTLKGSGTDIGGNSDQFQFTYTTGDISDYDVSGQITQQDQVNASDKLGLMVRDSISNTARFAYVASVNNGANFIFEYRSVPAGPVTQVTVAGHPLPYYVKISKTTTTYAAFISPDNMNWTQIGSAQNLNFGTDPTNVPHYGMAITSHNNALLSTGQISGFTLLGSTPLPIKLLSFTAKDINHDHVLISWATSMEHLVDHFEVQKSVGTSGFQTIAKVNAVGESETPQYYTADDNNPVPGYNYYRLKELDKDSKFYYTPTVSVNFDKAEGFEIFPNPADNYTNIHSPGDPIQEVNVYDVTGKLMQSIHTSGGLTTLRINTTDFPKAVYFIQVKTNTTTYRKKLFRQ